MAPLPVIADVARVTVEFATVDGVTPRSVFHVRTDGDNVPDVGAAILDAAPDFLYAPMDEGFNPIALSIILLDGTSGAVPVNASGASWCEDTGSPILPSLAAVVSLGTGLRGPANRGRQFIGPLCENNTQNGFVDSGTVSTLADNWETFIEALDTSSHNLVVASYTHADAHDVLTIQAKAECATQRRRLLQLRG